MTKRMVHATSEYAPWGLQFLDKQARASWPENILMTICGFSGLQASAMAATCPETLGDVVYVVDHISSTHARYAALVYEYYRDHTPTTVLAARNKVTREDVQRALVDIISCVRDSHLPVILTGGLRAWRQRQDNMQGKRYEEQREEPLAIVEGIGVFELAALHSLGCVTVGNFLDYLSEEDGIPLDGEYLTEEVVECIYKELRHLNVLANAKKTGREFQCRHHPAPRRTTDTEADIISCWPMNFWMRVVSDDGSLPPDDLLDSVDAALCLLQKEQRDYLLLRYRDGKTADEIAANARVKTTTVYRVWNAALVTCRRPDIERILRLGISECRRQTKDFNNASVQDMRTYPASILPLPPIKRLIRDVYSSNTVGSIMDHLQTWRSEDAHSQNEVNETAAEYASLSQAGVLRKCWSEGLDIRNPTSLLQIEKDLHLRNVLNALWEMDGAEKVWCPSDIAERIIYSAEHLLQPEDVERVERMLQGCEAVDGTLIAKLRPCVAVLRPPDAGPKIKKKSGKYRWPDNLLMRVFQCDTINELAGYIPERPADLEEAIAYVLDTKLTHQASGVIRAYFRDGNTCRKIGAELQVSGAYVGSIINTSINQFLCTDEVKRYFQFGYAKAKEAKELDTGVSEVTLLRPITDFPFNRRISNTFRRAGMETLDDVISLMRGTWPGRIAGMGIGSMGSTYAVLKDIGVVDYLQKSGNPIPKPQSKNVQFGHWGPDKKCHSREEEK